MRASVPIALLFVAITGCARSVPQRSAAKATRPTPAPGTLASAASFSQVYPLADGCAYIHADDESFWYICGGSAARVSGLPASDLTDIFPMADGSALLRDDVAHKFYSLRGVVASEVTVGTPSPAPVPAASRMPYLSGFHFVTSAASSRVAADAVDTAEAASTPLEDPEDDDGG